MEGVFILNGTTAVGISGVLTVLTGAIGMLFRQLLAAKEHQIADRDARLVEIGKDRDYWRTYSLRLIDPLERSVEMNEQAVHHLRRTAP